MGILQNFFNKPAPMNNDEYQPMLQSLLTMAWFVEAKDPYTGGHLWRVSRFSQLLALEAGESVASAARISLGGFLHDLGKVSIPDSILKKTDRLTDEEYDIIKTHPTAGMRMIVSHPMAGLVAAAVEQHHERPDGKGYPKGISGDEIPLAARIVGLCDAFDAMTSHRPYRAGMPKQKALSILEECAGTQFDARLVSHFLSLDEQGLLDHIIGHSDESIPLQECPMCGPTLVMQKDNKEGDHLYCPSCTGEFIVQPTEGHHLTAVPTGNPGAPDKLTPVVDNDLIARTVANLAKDLDLEMRVK